MKSLLIKSLILAAVVLSFTTTSVAQARCDREYRSCVRDCNAARDRIVNGNVLLRSQARIRYNQELTDCTVRFIGNRAGRIACQREAFERLQAALAALNARDRQAERDRITCITECRRRLRDCQRPTLEVPSLSGSISLDCIPGGPPCRGAVSEFCQVASGACDDCWRSMCGGGEWQIEAEMELQGVTLVAVSDRIRAGRVLVTAAVNGPRATLTVPSNLKLEQGEQLFFQVRPKINSRRPGKIEIKRVGR